MRWLSGWVTFRNLNHCWELVLVPSLKTEWFLRWQYWLIHSASASKHRKFIKDIFWFLRLEPRNAGWKARLVPPSYSSPNRSRQTRFSSFHLFIFGQFAQKPVEMKNVFCRYSNFRGPWLFPASSCSRAQSSSRSLVFTPRWARAARSRSCSRSGR